MPKNEDRADQQRDWDRASAELDVWAHDLPGAKAVVAKLEPQASTALSATQRTGRLLRVRVDSGFVYGRRLDTTGSDEFRRRMARAYASVDDDNDALAMAQAAVGPPERDLAMIDVIACQARNGHSDVACDELKQISTQFEEPAVERLAQGWALAKDSRGISTWIEQLSSHHLKSIAEIGVAEGLLHTHVRDLYDGPSWRSSI